MYRLTKRSGILTRVATPVTYNPFTQIVDVSGKLVSIPVPINREIVIHRLSVLFSWAITTSPLTCRFRFLDDDPVLGVNFVDNTDGGSYNLSAFYDNLTTTTDISATTQYGLSYGNVNFPTPIVLRSKSGNINVFFFQTGGTDAPAGGQVKFSIYYQTLRP